MGIVLFLVDTSASMNQKTYLGASYLDVAKVAVETFLKVCLGHYGTGSVHCTVMNILRAADHGVEAAF